MSDAALQQFEQARRAQLDRNEARRMRTLVNQARGDIHGAGARWPFELTQNAHDPGARDGIDGVNIWVTFDGHTVAYEHDGKPFTMQDLAALLSGGSNKEFESTETTGRFGTGFLVTHVLSLQIGFRGLLVADTGHEEVSIRLDRDGDEEGIFDNTTHCYQGIKDAKKLAAINGHRTARFEYQTDNVEAAQVGVSAFHATLPYLYGTCDHLGTVNICDESGASIAFSPQAAVERGFSRTHVRERQFSIVVDGGAPKIMKTVRLRLRTDSSSSLVVTLEQVDRQWRVCVPSDDAARLFCRFPIRASDFVPINAVIDGRFDLRQERDRVLMKESDKEQIAEALGLLPTLVDLATKEAWRDGHRLARVGMPDRAFGEKLDEPLRIWWRAKLSAAARALAAMPIVQTAGGMLSATGISPTAVFVVPRFDLVQRSDELSFDQMCGLVSDLRDTHPPALQVGPDWTAIAFEWAGLDVLVRRITLTEMAETVRNGAAKLDDLKVDDPLGWLARFLDLLGKVAGKHNCGTIMHNLLPDQNKVLKSPGDLYRDEGIKAVLKDIAQSIRLDVRGRLVLDELFQCSADGNFSHMKALLTEQVAKSLGEEAIITECLEELAKHLPDNKPISVEKQCYRETSVDLLKYLWDTRAAEAAALAQRCPLVVSDSTAARWASNRKIMSPVTVWHADAKPFAKLYKEDRILSEEYLTRLGGERALVDALVTWKIAFIDPLCSDAPRDLRDERLKALAVEGEDCTNVTVADIDLSQIALLPNELIQRCQSDVEIAKLLLGLVLKHAAPHDPSWRETREIVGRMDRADVHIKVRPALWLGDLKTKAWVPVQGEKGVEPVMANAGNLRPLLDPTWLSGNDAGVDLLSRHFGFNALELRLLSTVPSQEARGQVENGLANIVQALGSDPSKYSDLAADLASRQQREAEKERNRQFGLGVQFAIEKYLDQRELHPDFIDCGYDYDLFLDDAPPIDAGTHHFRLADYFLEVKATTTGEVRLTPAQAQKASENNEKFVLCVVDLRGIGPDRMAAEWKVTDVEPKAKVVVGIGDLVLDPHTLVDEAKDCEVGIRNDKALRYGVPVSVWEKGESLANWIDSLKLAPPVA
ncbi:MAG: hypothetical protein HYU36_08445 [Planctomycetes bacterium]|nr:hypothetical protein [Planctomycetota bacterium]